MSATAPAFEPAADSMRAAVAEWMFRPEPGRPLVPPDSILTQFLRSWATFRNEYPGAHGAWQMERSTVVRFDSLQLVTLRHEERAYTGGAHGMHHAVLATFDARTGRRLDLGDFVLLGSLDSIEARGERAFRRARGIAPGVPLPSTGFFRAPFGTGAFELSDNFGVERAGLVFHYNPYEIAPYALGATDFTLPWSELGPFLRPDGPIAALAR